MLNLPQAEHLGRPSWKPGFICCLTKGLFYKNLPTKTEAHQNRHAHFTGGISSHLLNCDLLEFKRELHGPPLKSNI